MLESRKKGMGGDGGTFGASISLDDDEFGRMLFSGSTEFEVDTVDNAGLWDESVAVMKTGLG